MKYKLTLAALLTGSTALHGAAVLHYYDFESNFDDQIGAANGTAGAEVGTVIGGGFDSGNAAFFPASLSGGGPFGPTGYVDLSPNVPTLTGAFSFSYWVRLNVDGSTEPRGIFDFSGDGDDGPQSLYIQNGANAGRLAFRVDGAGTSNAVAFADVPEDGSWFSVIATFDPASNLDLYIDGALEASVAATGVTPAAWSTDQYLGAFNINGIASARGIDGDLDDFAIYDDILSPAQISGLADGSLSPASIPEPSGALLSLLGLGLLTRRKRA